MGSRPIKGGAFSLLWLVLTVALICFLYFKLVRVYFNKSQLGDLGIESSSGQEIDTSSYKAIVDSTKKVVEKINKEHMDQLEDIYQRGK